MLNYEPPAPAPKKNINQHTGDCLATPALCLAPPAPCPAHKNENYKHTGTCPAPKFLFRNILAVARHRPTPAPAGGIAEQNFVSNILAIVRRKFAGVRRRRQPRLLVGDFTKSGGNFVLNSAFNLKILLITITILLLNSFLLFYIFLFYFHFFFTSSVTGRA